MKRERNKKQTIRHRSTEKPASPLPAATQPAELSAEQKNQQEWERLIKLPEYFAKDFEFERSKINHQTFLQTLKSIDELMEQEEWFAKNTPFPFKAIHSSRIAELAFLITGYLKKIALAGNNEAIEKIAFITVDLTETLMELLTTKSETAKNYAALPKDPSGRFDSAWNMAAKSNAELMKGIARQIPYWPMLRFLNTRANAQTQFQQIAKDLELGKDCPINVSESANYSLETPINSFVWKCLRHFQGILWIIQNTQNPVYQYAQTLNPAYADHPVKTFEDAAERYVIKEIKSPVTGRPMTIGLIKREEIPIYKASCKLPPLTKSTAKNWADTAIMPYVKIRFPDLRQVPELKAHKTGPTGKRYAPVRLSVIQSLKQMARES